MELVKHQGLPDTVQFFARIVIVRVGQRGGCAQVFDRAQQRFLLAAAAFHVLLRGQGATVQFEIQLALPDGHFRAGVLCKLLMRLAEEVIRLFDAHLGDAFEVLVAVQVLHHVARGAATAITETEEQKRAVGEILVLEVLLGVVEFLNLAPSSISIRRREVGEDARAVDAFPHERVVRELGGIVPRDLLREEPFVPGTAGDLRPCAGVSEAVRQPYALGLHTEMFLEVFAAICNLANQRFAGGQHAIGFHPHAADRDEPTFFDALFHALEDVRMILFQPGVLLGGAHRVFEVGVGVHQSQCVGYGAGHLAARLAHRPQPCGVDMCVADSADVHGRGVGRLGQYVGECCARGFHGFGVVLVVGVERTLQRLRELPVARRLLVGEFHQGADHVEVHGVVLVAFIEFGQIGGLEYVRLIRLAGGMVAQFSLNERRYAEQERVAGGFEVQGEAAVFGDRHLRVAFSIHERHPIVERVYSFDGGAVGTVDEALDMAAAGVRVPAKVEDELQRFAFRVAGRHSTGQAEPDRAPCGAPFAAERKRLEVDVPSIELREELVSGHWLSGNVKGLHRKLCDRWVDMRVHALTHYALAPLQLLFRFQEHLLFTPLISAACAATSLCCPFMGNISTCAIARRRLKHFSNILEGTGYDVKSLSQFSVFRQACPR